MKNKVVDIDTAIDQIKKNDTVLFGGFPASMLGRLFGVQEVEPFA